MATRGQPPRERFRAEEEHVGGDDATGRQDQLTGLDRREPRPLAAGPRGTPVDECGVDLPRGSSGGSGGNELRRLARTRQPEGRATSWSGEEDAERARDDEESGKAQHQGARSHADPRGQSRTGR